MDYKQALIIARVKTIDENKQLDVPFQVFFCVMVKNNVIHYDFSKLSDGDEVLALVSYMVDHPTTPMDDTYAVASLCDNVVSMPWEDLGVREDSVITNFKTDPRVRTFWNVTKAEYFANTDENGNTQPYQGEDKNELAEFYPSELL